MTAKTRKRIDGSDKRRPEEQQAHDEAVKRLAEERFGLSDWEVSFNIGGRGDDKPDIVALHAGQIVAVGEVETEATISPREAMQWKAMAESSPRFYLFVPDGTEQVAVKLIEEHEVHCAGLRRYSCSGGFLKVNSVPCKNGSCRSDEHIWWRNIGRGREVS